MTSHFRFLLEELHNSLHAVVGRPALDEEFALALVCRMQLGLVRISHQTFREAQTLQPITARSRVQ